MSSLLSSRSVVLFCRPNCYPVLSSCSVVLTVVLFCRPNYCPVLSSYLSSCSVILTVVLFFRPNSHPVLSFLLSSYSVVLTVVLTVVLFCRPTAIHNKIWGSICAKIVYICLCLKSLPTCLSKSVYVSVYVVC